MEWTTATYCGARWWRLRDWRLYGLYRKLPTGFSVGPFIIYKNGI